MAQVQTQQAGRKEHALWSQTDLHSDSTSYVTLGKPFPSRFPHLEGLATTCTKCGLQGWTSSRGTNTGVVVINNLWRVQWSKTDLEISWEPQCTSCLDKSQFAPLKGPQWSVRVLQGSQEIPSCFWLTCSNMYLPWAYSVPGLCQALRTIWFYPHETYNLGEKTSFQNDLTSRCQCTSVISPTKERYMATCNAATSNEEIGPVWGDTGWLRQ